ncbi:SURF1 family protein [Kineobactrum sediminis]|uniref:SURF1-like protein n=1 Tax=Kineobactrum sediminis TaxID=1905677 RepID=A0A2N5Y7L1_9GAMM|nr:SURF1 family protein [Kineobactrum sediminis]PLW84384.1 SURF1 family protein [Kineobactrum sediminis]
MVRLQLDLEWRITLLTLLLFPALVALGFWQLQRADEKASLQINWEERKQQAPVALDTLPGTAEDAYRRVALRGQFLPGHYLLLDNRIVAGRFGYEVVGLFVLPASNQAVLVNRGWIAGDPGRQQLPEVTEPAGMLDITGHVYVPPGQPFLLGEQQLSPPWPLRVQALEIDKLGPLLATVTDSALFPYVVRIDEGQPGALAVDWQVVNASPEKHQGYAFQWFTMAAVLAFFFLLRSSNLWQLITRKEDDK